MPNGVPMSWLRTSYDHPPLFVAEGKGARFRDVDGHEYSDFNVADMSMFTGYAPEPVVEAVSRRVARRRPVHAAERGRALGRRGARPPIRVAEMAVHAERHAREHGGDPHRARVDRPRQGPVLRREVPRPLRRGARRPPGREAGPGGRRSAARRHVQDEDRAVQRRGCPAERPGAAGRRHRDHRAGDHEQRRAAAAGARVPRCPPGDHARDRHRAPARRDAHACRRAGRAHEDVVAASPTWSRSGSRSPRGSPWAPTA